MNFLFYFIQGIVLGAFFLLLYLILPESFWSLFPEKVRQLKTKIFIGLCATSILAMCFIGVMSYGPRVELSRTRIPDPPESREVVSGDQLVEESKRVGQFDKKLKEEKP